MFSKLAQFLRITYLNTNSQAPLMKILIYYVWVKTQIPVFLTNALQ